MGSGNAGESLTGLAFWLKNKRLSFSVLYKYNPSQACFVVNQDLVTIIETTSIIRTYNSNWLPYDSLQYGIPFLRVPYILWIVSNHISATDKTIYRSQLVTKSTRFYLLPTFLRRPPSKNCYRLVTPTRLLFPTHSIRAHCSEEVGIDYTRGTSRDKRCVGHFHCFSADVMTLTHMAPIPSFLFRISAIARFRLLQQNHIILNKQSCPTYHLSKPFTVGPTRYNHPVHHYR